MSTSVPYSDVNLRHALTLHPQNVSLQSLARGFDIKENELTELRNHLKALVDEGFAVSDKKDCFRAKNPLSELVVVRVLDDPENLENSPRDIKLAIEGVADSFPFTATIKSRIIRETFGDDLKPGTRLAVTLKTQNGTELLVNNIIDRYGIAKQPSIVGKFNKKAIGRGEERTFRSFAHGLTALFKTSAVSAEELESGAFFYAQIPSTLNPYDPVLKITEQKWDPDTGESISLIIAKKYGIEPNHPGKVEKEALAACRRPLSIAGRRDLSLERIYVIDPANAHDHDDGIMIERTRDGYRTLVVVADIPYFVRPDTDLSLSARDRGFTNYLPDKAFHMLPEILVKKASLYEGHSKPVIYVEQFWDLDGIKMGKPEIGAGIVASHIQKTYGQFDDMIMSQPSNISAYVELGEILVERMREEKVTFDIGDNDRISSFSEMLVSSLMIESNAAIAEFLLKNNVPFLSRSHTGSDNMHAFADLKEKLKGWKYEVPENIAEMTNEGLRRIIAQAERRNDKVRVEKAIRSDFLNQAIYSLLPHSHFGLNLRNYTHATSPIRRYPDLLALRGVHNILGNHELGLSENDIEHMEKTAKAMNMRQNLGKLIATDAQKYYAVRELVEGRILRATLGKIDDYRAEIILGNQGGLRKTFDLDRLPDGWRSSPRRNSLIYNNNIYLREGASVRVKIANVRPHMASWDVSSMEPSYKAARVSPFVTQSPAPMTGIA